MEKQHKEESADGLSVLKASEQTHLHRLHL